MRLLAVPLVVTKLTGYFRLERNFPIRCGEWMVPSSRGSYNEISSVAGRTRWLLVCEVADCIRVGIWGRPRGHQIRRDHCFPRPLPIAEELLPSTSLPPITPVNSDRAIGARPDFAPTRSPNPCFRSSSVGGKPNPVFQKLTPACSFCQILPLAAKAMLSLR